MAEASGGHARMVLVVVAVPGGAYPETRRRLPPRNPPTSTQRSPSHGHLRVLASGCIILHGPTCHCLQLCTAHRLPLTDRLDPPLPPPTLKLAPRRGSAPKRNRRLQQNFALFSSPLPPRIPFYSRSRQERRCLPPPCCRRASGASSPRLPGRVSSPPCASAAGERGPPRQRQDIKKHALHALTAVRLHPRCRTAGAAGGEGRLASARTSRITSAAPSPQSASTTAAGQPEPLEGRAASTEEIKNQARHALDRPRSASFRVPTMPQDRTTSCGRRCPMGLASSCAIVSTGHGVVGATATTAL
ncbi:hypothetical protein U9M48_032682 [Paspalum notatum var. saurae]|uniref:Uncharacterized protein n=1 Tax=Paspalum notatum var. saurae TaxID=547442 RepID=A0AAQ3U5A4_PASNO